MEREIELNENTCNENCAEWLTGQKRVTFTFSQRKFITKAKKYAAEYPDEVQITAENLDGSIVVHAPLSYFKFSRPKQVSEETKQAAGERMKKYQQSKLNA